MDINRAKEIVSALAEGIDPSTGELLPHDHICNHADVVRALYTLLKVTENAKPRFRPENSGKPWTDETDTELRKMFEEGKQVSEMSKHLGRSRMSIDLRLARLGLKKFN